jgi:hypothetical protein
VSNPDPFEEDLFKQDVALPVREFFFTLDQIAYMLDMDQQVLMDTRIYYTGRTGAAPGNLIRATNIARPDAQPDWRVSETAFKIWMTRMHIPFTQPVPGRFRKRNRSK